MKPIIRLLSAALLAASLLPSCEVFDADVTVVDRGFKVGNDIAWNSDYLAYTLRLTLLEGADGEYTFNYSIDGDPLIKIKSSGGSELESGSSVALSAKGTSVFLLPTLSEDKKHQMSLEFIRGDVSRKYALTLPNTAQRQVGVKVDAGLEFDYTRVVLTNLMGSTVSKYTVSFFLDGTLFTEMKYMNNTFDGTMEVDFSHSESYTFEMPFIVAGEHTLKVDVRSSSGEESTSVVFTEPQRKKTSLKFSYNDYTGKIMLSSDYNPLSTSFKVTLDVTVTGSVTYRHEQFFGIADPSTETFTVTGESDYTVAPGLDAVAVDNGLLKKLMDEIYNKTRTDAANAIGNGNARTVHSDITSVKLAFTVHSQGDYAGKTAVTITPGYSSGFPIKYTYKGNTWTRSSGTVQTITPSYTVNGGVPATVRTL